MDGGVWVGAEFEDGLAADSAGGCWGWTVGYDDDPFYFGFAEVGDHGGDRAAFGADGGAVDGVFYVVAGVEFVGAPGFNYGADFKF